MIPTQLLKLLSSPHWGTLVVRELRYQNMHKEQVMYIVLGKRSSRHQVVWQVKETESFRHEKSVKHRRTAPSPPNHANGAPSGGPQGPGLRQMLPTSIPRATLQR